MEFDERLSPLKVERVEIGIDCRDPVMLAQFWAAATGYEIGDFDPAEIYLDLRPPSKAFPVIYFQRVPEGKNIKNRLHLDLYVEDIDVAADALVARGGKRIGEFRRGSAGGKWQVMVDPEENEFCLCELQESQERA